MADWTFYQSYIKSPRWKAKRELALSALGRFCRACGTSYGPMNVHHVDYARLGNESLSDFVILCERCHKDLTKQWRASGRNSGWTLREFTTYYIKQRKRNGKRR